MLQLELTSVSVDCGEGKFAPSRRNDPEREQLENLIIITSPVIMSGSLYITEDDPGEPSLPA